MEQRIELADGVPKNTINIFFMLNAGEIIFSWVVFSNMLMNAITIQTDQSENILTTRMKKSAERSKQRTQHNKVDNNAICHRT